MAQVSEPRTTSSAASAQPNIQDIFLNLARRDRLAVTIFLMDGRQLEARIKNFDKFAVIVDVAGADHLIFKHAIATIETQRSVASYFPPQHA
jgi:host factor-I protein